MTPLEAARQYLAAGLCPVPIPYRSKAPVIDRWQRLRLTPEDLPRHFGGQCNLGVNLGEASRGLTDVDLDCPEALELAERLLPPARAFGRAGKPRSHRLYWAPGTVTEKFSDPIGKRTCLLELRGTPARRVGEGLGGSQTVFPPSVHEGTGELIEWSTDPRDLDVTPTVDADALHQACVALACACLLRRYAPSLLEAYLAAPAMPPNGTPAELLPAMRRWLGLAPLERAHRRPTEALARFEDARTRFVADHPLEATSRGGPCPASGCEGRNSFKLLPGDSQRATCFHSSHPDGCGGQGEGCHVFDALDLEAFNAGRTPADHLRAEGYLAAQRPQPDPAYAPALSSPPPEPPPDIEERQPGDDDGDDPVEDGRPEPPHSADDPNLALVEERPDYLVRPGQGNLAVQFALQALARDATVYQRGNRLVYISQYVKDERTEERSGIERAAGAPIIADLSQPLLWEKLSALVQWQRTTVKGELRNVDPPETVVASVAARAAWEGVSALEGIITSPALRPDGSILDRPGFDSATGLFLATREAALPIPAAPTRVDALAAIDTLSEVICDFPFKSGDDQLAWIAALLSVIARPALGLSNVPLFLIDANGKGTGKSIAADAIAIIGTGQHSAPRVVYSHDPIELDKRIATFLGAGDALGLFDNVRGDFGDAVLDALLTSNGLYQVRRLGGNSAKDRLILPVRAVFLATANNATLAADTCRRVVHIRLESELERPDLRTGFRHFPLLPWVRAERPRLLTAALTVLRGWFVAGRPRTEGLPAFGSFEEWSDLVRQVLVWLELGDPASTRERLQEADPNLSFHAAVLVGLKSLDTTGRGLSTATLKQRIESGECSDLKAAFDGAGLLEEGQVLVRRLGRRLKELEGKRFRGAFLTSRWDPHANSNLWSVTSA